MSPLLILGLTYERCSIDPIPFCVFCELFEYFVDNKMGLFIGNPKLQGG